MPWTQSLALTWRPELRFYEKRFDVLRALEERGELWAFRAHEDRVQARLFDRWQQMSVRQNGASLHLLSPQADPESAWAALVLAFDMIAPTRPRHMSVAFQYVADLPLAFDDAVMRGYGSVLGRFAPKTIKVSDWAVLFDFSMDQPAGVSAMAEFGVLRADEVPVRLARSLGRLRFVDPPSTSPELWEDAHFEPVSIFMDVALHADIDPSVHALDALKGFWETSRIETGSLFADLKLKLVPDDDNERVAL
jgi:hypothetical protein